MATSLGLGIAFSGEESHRDYETDFESILSDGIPDSFDDLIEKLARPNRPQGLILVPNGRSLDRRHATFRDPRVLASFLNQDLFVGFSPVRKRAEVIAWNAKKGIYEFFIIDPLEPGKSPRLTRPSRGICTTCHQNGGPIFSARPWSETNAPDALNSQITSRLERESRFTSRFRLMDSNFMGTFDAKVRDANLRLQYRRACNHACDGQSEDCKLRLLSAALRISRERVAAEESPDVRYFIERIWPAIVRNGFRQVSSVIPNRDPMEKLGRGGVTRIVRGGNLMISEGGRLRSASAENLT